MRLIAHRGFAGVAPENTITAVRAAAARADVVEFDVRRCGSGELVVVHDETLERVTGEPGRVAETDLADLRERTVFESGEGIPTLEEMLEALPPSVDVNLELKALGIAGDVLAAIEAAGVDNRIVCTSFLLPELRTIHGLDSDQPTGLLVARDRRRPVTTAVELGCEVVGAHARRCLFTRLIDRAKRVDLEVHAWSVPGRIGARLLGWRGVDCVSSDRPIRL